MIEKTLKPCWKIGDSLFEDVETAQQFALKRFVTDKVFAGVKDDEKAEKFAAVLLAEKDALIDLLTMKPNSRPKARAASGAVRAPRKSRATKVTPATGTEAA